MNSAEKMKQITKNDIEQIQDRSANDLNISLGKMKYKKSAKHSISFIFLFIFTQSN